MLPIAMIGFGTSASSYEIKLHRLPLSEEEASDVSCRGGVPAPRER
jgi:hypothetical protein